MSVAESTTYSAAHTDNEARLGDYISILARRRTPIAVTGLVVLLLALAAALLWPPTYTSSATILIEEQEIPEDMVRSTITSYATQQIETIRQRVLTVQNIMDMVEKHSLYDSAELASIPNTQIAGEFIEAVSLELLNTEVVDRRSGRATEATVAFTLSFGWDDPRKALAVANELANLFLDENLRTRSAKAASTADFLRQEADSLDEEVKALEMEISRFKSEYKNALPESYQVNMQNLTRYESQVTAAEERVRALAQRELDLESRLASTSAYAPTVLPSGEAVLGDVDRLKALQSEYRNKAARYSDNHPDVVRLRREIDTLTAQVGYGGTRSELLKQLAGERNELASLESIYEQDHPEVVAQRKLVAQLEAQSRNVDDSRQDIQPDNPAYMVIDNQLQSLRMEKTALEDQVVQMRKQIEDLNQAILQTPMVEQTYNSLLRNREVASAKYLDLRVKLKEAELASQIEEGRRGQRFTMIDSPTMPQKPSSPNRVAILFLGAVLALAAGMAVGFLLEITDESIRSEKNLGTLMGVTPLAVIPYIETPQEQSSRRPVRKVALIVGMPLLVVFIGLLLVHFFYQPLDVLWFTVLRNFGIG